MESLSYEGILSMVERRIRFATATDIPVRERYKPLFLWGPPGVGKSYLIAEAAERQQCDLIDIRLSLLDSVDLHGVPFPNREKRIVEWLPAGILPQAPLKKPTVLFLDELNTAPINVQNAALQLILDRRVGDYRLPDQVAVFAAGNRAEDGAHVTRISKALSNRFAHVVLEANLESWMDWALNAGLPAELVMFLKFKPALLHAMDPQAKGESFPSPRSWEWVGYMTNALRDTPRELYDEAEATVGRGAATEYTAFLELSSEMPDPDKVIADPEKAPIPSPDKPGVLYALLGALIDRFNRSDKRASVAKSLVVYAGRLDGEFSVTLVKPLIRLDKAAVQNAGAVFRDWCAAHRSLLLD